MNIDNLAKRQVYSLPGYKLVKYFQAAFPVYKVILNITVQKKKEISIIQEFCLKLLSVGIKGIDEISGFLGLDKFSIENAMLELRESDLITIKFLQNKNEINITEKGKKSLSDMALITPENISITVYVDGLTGHLQSINQRLHAADNLKSSGVHFINKNIDIPSLSSISFNELIKAIKLQKKERPEEVFEGDLLAINEVEKCYINYKKMNVLVFMEVETGEIDIKVYDRSDRVMEYESIILRMEKEGFRQIKTDDIIFEDETVDLLANKIPQEIIDSAKEYEATIDKLTIKKEIIEDTIQQQEEILTVSDISDEDKLSATQKIRELNYELEEAKKQLHAGNRILNTFDHRPLLEATLEKAKRLIVIVSPWIKDDAFDYELEMKIDKALQRKVNIIIGYGISDKEDYEQKRNVDRLKEIQKRKHGQRLKIIKLANTHEKVLICDDKYVVVTSFNWLSFKGDPKRGFRQETGVYSESKYLINEITKQLELRMKISINKDLN